MAIEKNIVIGADLSGIEVKLNELIDLLKNSQTEADKTSKSVEQVADEVKEVGKSAKEGAKGVKVLSNGIRGIGLALKAAGIGLLIEGFQLFKDVLKSNQGVADSFAVTLQTLIFAFNGIIKAVSSGDFLSIPKVLAEAREQAIELVALQNEILLKEGERSKLQLKNLIIAEKQRQLRDDETKTIESRIEANEKLNDLLTNQILDEQHIVQLKINAANAELLRNDNIENKLALLEAETEMLEIQERLEGQMSEYQMNRNSLKREEADLEIMIFDQFAEQFRIEKETAIELMNNRKKALRETWSLETGLANAKILQLDEEIAKHKENTIIYQELVGQRAALDAEKHAFIKKHIADEQQLRRDNIQENFDLAAQGLGALQALNDAFAKDDEESAEKAFNINKSLQTGQAIINTAAAVTAQLAVPQDALTGANFVKAGIALATGIAQVKTIQSAQFGGDVGSLDSNIAQPQSPSFNLVGSTGNNAILESLRNNPVKAYVVGSDVTSQQQLDRNRINQVSFP